MFLQQEYFERHKISPDPIIYNSNKDVARVFLKVDNEKKIMRKYRVLTISGLNKEGDPGKFSIEMFYPSYNSGRKNVFFTEDKSFGSTLHWKTYKEEITSYIRKLKMLGMNSIKCQKELELVFWEVLLFSFDSLMTKFPVVLNNKIYCIFDDTLTLNEKIAITRKCTKFLKKDCSFQSYSKDLLYGFDFLKKNFKINNCSSWIFNLI